MPTIQVPVKEFQPHDWGLDFLDAFDRLHKRFFLLCWHRRARKTTHVLNLLIRECIKNPKSVYGYIGPTITQAKSIIWRDPNMLNRYLPMERVLRKNESELYIEFDNLSVLRVEGADRPDRLRGPDWAGIVLDEWALMKREMWEEILRPVIAQSPKRWAAFTFTPKGINHAHEYWLRAKEWDDWYTSMLKVSESKLLADDELLKARREMSDALYNQEFECSFVSREEKSLINSEMLEDLNSVVLSYPSMKKLIACDPSEGGDECVIKVFENTKVVETKILHEHNEMIISGHIQNLGFKYGTTNYVGDVIGCGGGIASDLELKNWNVQRIQSASSAFDKDKHYNHRTELWWYCSEQIRQRQVYPIDDTLTRQQLIAPKYDVIDSNGKIRVESKKYTKEMLGRSPDHGDCYVYGIWGLQGVDTTEGPKRLTSFPNKSAYKPMSRTRPMALRR